MTHQTTEQSEREELIRHMVNRFLSWKLPKNFYPDSFISFDREKHDTWGGYPNSWPTGTNLFTADQAKAMLEHLLDGYEPAAKPAVDLAEVLDAPGCERIKDFYSVGPVQRAAVESFAAALLSSDAPAGGEAVPVFDFTALEKAMTLASLLAGSVGMNDVSGSAGYKNDLRDHLSRYVVRADALLYTHPQPARTAEPS